MRKVVLDTNAYSDYLRGNTRVALELSYSQSVYMPIFVIGELMAGHKAGSKERENKEILHKFLAKPSIKIVYPTLETGEIFGHLKNELRKAGTPVPVTDIWIAAQAVELGAIIITLDKHFKLIPGLRLWES